MAALGAAAFAAAASSAALAAAASAGVVMGARVPIVLTSRSEDAAARLASAAVASVIGHKWAAMLQARL